jgi:hypothetical protein
LPTDAILDSFGGTPQNIERRWSVVAYYRVPRYLVG